MPTGGCQGVVFDPISISAVMQSVDMPAEHRRDISRFHQLLVNDIPVATLVVGRNPPWMMDEDENTLQRTGFLEHSI